MVATKSNCLHYCSFLLTIDTLLSPSSTHSPSHIQPLKSIKPPPHLSLSLSYYFYHYQRAACHWTSLLILNWQNDLAAELFGPAPPVPRSKQRFEPKRHWIDCGCTRRLPSPFLAPKRDTANPQLEEPSARRTLSLGTDIWSNYAQS